jgi:hypothetical protein
MATYKKLVALLQITVILVGESHALLDGVESGVPACHRRHDAIAVQRTCAWLRSSNK